MQDIFTRLKQRLTHLPGMRSWLWACALLIALGFLALLIALIFGRDALQSDTTIPLPWYVFAPASLFVPALIEEAVFRGVLQPPDVRSAPKMALSALSLSLFVLWHPIQVWLSLPMGQDLFRNLPFLALVAALGISCTVLTQCSQSLWPAVVLHWVVVLCWKFAV